MGPLEIIGMEGTVQLNATKERTVATVLALNAGKVVPDETLAEVLWGEDLPRSSVKSLHTHVFRIRKAVGAEVVVRKGTGYFLALDKVQVDVRLFEEAAARGRAASRDGDIRNAAAAWTQALALWRGGPELPRTPRGLALTTAWEEAYLAGLTERIDAELALGRHAELVAELEALVGIHPLLERLWGQLIVALYRSDRQADALHAYQRLRATLIEQLGVEPSGTLRQLEAAVLAQDSALEAGNTIPDGTAMSPSPTLPSGVVTFMLTDVARSTYLWEVAPDAMTDALARHDVIIASVVATHGGAVLKPRGEGDSTFSVFQLATDAAGAAAEVQRSLAAERWPSECDIKVRIALHTGEALERDGDYFGRTVNRASRIRAVAEPGQILLSRATAELIVDHLAAGLSLQPAGTRQLRDLGRPETVCELWVDLEPSVRPQAGTHGPVPTGATSRLARVLPDASFVGRAQEQETLWNWFEQAVNGDPRFVLISGRAGIGKSALTTRLVAALPPNVRLLTGVCHEDRSVPYLPLATALEPLLTPETPDLSPLASEDPDSVPADGDRWLDWDGSATERQRLRLFLTVTRLIMAELEQRPVVLVIEDLHWADDATLRLLTHVLGMVAVHRATAPTPALVIMTCRSREESSPVDLALSRLEREACYRELGLPAMSGLEVSELVTRLRDTPPEPRLLGDLMEATDGTPLLVRSVVQRLTQTGSLVVGTGGRLRAKGDILSRRAADIDSEVVARLEVVSGSCRQMLTIAALLGQRGSLAELEAVVGYDPDDVDNALDEASEAGLLEDDGFDYWFGHSELPRALSRRTNRTRRQRIHAAIADRLEQHYRHASISHATDIARHLCLSGSSAPRDRVRHYASIAADQAFAAGAWAESARYHDAMLDAEDSVTSQTPDLLVRAGIAHFRNHNHEAAQERLRRAVDLCRDLGETRLWGMAAITLTKSLTISGSVRKIDQHPLEEFLAATEDEVGLHARALAQLADSRYAAMDVDAGMKLARRALDAAKDAKDDQVRCEVELALGVQHLVRLELPDAKACFRRCRESAESLGDPWALLWGDTRLPIALWTEGHLEESDNLAEQAVMSAESCFDSAEASLALAARTGVAVDRGRFDEAERFGALSYQHFLRSDYFYAMMIAAPALVAGRAYRGNSAAAGAAISRAASTGIDVRHYQLALLALTGRKPELHAALEKTPLRIRRARPLNAFDLAFCALEVEIGDAAGDPVIMAATIDYLQRADANGVMFTIGWAASVPRLLGVASFGVGRHDSAEVWLRQAITATEGAGAFGEAARARLDLARLLLDNGNQEDRHRAVTELDMAITAFRRMGMAAFLPIAERLRQRSP